MLEPCSQGQTDLESKHGSGNKSAVNICQQVITSVTKLYEVKSYITMWPCNKKPCSSRKKLRHSSGFKPRSRNTWVECEYGVLHINNGLVIPQPVTNSDIALHPHCVCHLHGRYQHGDHTGCGRPCPYARTTVWSPLCASWAAPRGTSTCHNRLKYLYRQLTGAQIHLCPSEHTRVFCQHACVQQQTVELSSWIGCMHRSGSHLVLLQVDIFMHVGITSLLLYFSFLA